MQRRKATILLSMMVSVSGLSSGLSGIACDTVTVPTSSGYSTSSYSGASYSSGSYSSGSYATGSYNAPMTSSVSAPNCPTMTSMPSMPSTSAAMMPVMTQTSSFCPSTYANTVTTGAPATGSQSIYVPVCNTSTYSTGYSSGYTNSGGNEHVSISSPSGNLSMGSHEMPSMDNGRNSMGAVGNMGRGAVSNAGGLANQARHNGGNVVRNVPVAVNNAGAGARAQNNDFGRLIGVQQTPAHLVLFNSANQMLSGARGQACIGEAGSVISRTGEQIIVHRGRVTINSGAQPSQIQTRYGTLHLEASSVAVVQDDQNKPFSITAITGRGEIPIAEASEEKKLDLRAGEQLFFSDGSLEEEELIPVEGKTVVFGGIEKRPTISKTNPHIVRVEHQSARAGKSIRLAGSRQSVLGTANHVGGKEISFESWESMLSLVSKVSPVQLLVQPGTQLLESPDGKMTLLTGAIFLPANKDMALQTPFGSVSAKKNSLAMIESFAGTCRVKALSGPGDISISSNGHVVDLAPGQEILLSDHKPAQHEINPPDAIARRVRAAASSETGFHVAINDFSMASMLNYRGYVQMIKNHDDTGKLLNRIVKTAAVVEMVGRGRGKYTYSNANSADGQQISSAIK